MRQEQLKASTALIDPRARYDTITTGKQAREIGIWNSDP